MVHSINNSVVQVNQYGLPWYFILVISGIEALFIYGVWTLSKRSNVAVQSIPAYSGALIANRI